MTDTDLLQHATEFEFLPAGAKRGDRNANYFSVKVARRGVDQWAVVNMGLVWNGEDFEYEPLPSSRTEEFKRKTRFTLEEAVEIARIQPDQLTVSGMKYADFASRR